MKFSPNVWGPFFWNTFHIAALGYPESPSYTEKKAAKELFESMQFLIPCAICREHYKNHLAENPITPFLDRRSDLFKWTVLLHNKVNGKLNKKEWTEHEVMTYYALLGKMDRSPIWTKDDMERTDIRSFLKGLFSGVIGLVVISGVCYIVNKYTNIGVKTFNFRLGQKVGS